MKENGGNYPKLWYSFHVNHFSTYGINIENLYNNTSISNLNIYQSDDKSLEKDISSALSSTGTFSQEPSEVSVEKNIQLDNSNKINEIQLLNKTKPNKQFYHYNYFQNYRGSGSAGIYVLPHNNFLNVYQIHSILKNMKYEKDLFKNPLELIISKLNNIDDVPILKTTTESVNIITILCKLIEIFQDTLFLDLTQQNLDRYLNFNS